MPNQPARELACALGCRLLWRVLATQDAAGDTPTHLFCGPMAVLQLLHLGGQRKPPREVRNASGLLPSEAIVYAATTSNPGVSRCI